MDMYSQLWLRSFLRLDAAASAEGIPSQDVWRQEKTILRALSLLDRQPGVLLADEVGMGKTFEALGVIAAFLHRRPQARVLVLTPGPDLNIKWRDEFTKATERGVYDFKDTIHIARNLSGFMQGAAAARVLVAPITLFRSDRGRDDQAYLLSLYCDWKKFPDEERDQIFSRFGRGRLTPVDVRAASFLGLFPFAQLVQHLVRVFHTGPGLAKGLDSLYKEHSGPQGFGNLRAVRNALAVAKFRLVRALLSAFDLLILDEAHKLKNAGTMRARSVRVGLGKRYHKVVLLTATPFQLGIDEMRQVFQLFRLATSAPPELGQTADRLFDDIREYQTAYNEFENAWRRIDAATAAEFTQRYQADASFHAPIADPSVRIVADRFKRVYQLKVDRIEPGLRQWMIRSLSEEKRIYRAHKVHQLPWKGSIRLPFLVYERFIFELFRSGSPTHKTAVQINMASSYPAVRTGELLKDGSERALNASAEAYRGMLRQVIDSVSSQQGAHPKVDHVVRETLIAADRGEKTLIFCARVETLSQLSKRLESTWLSKHMLQRWRLVEPTLSYGDVFGHSVDEKLARGWHAQLQKRFHDRKDRCYEILHDENRAGHPLWSGLRGCLGRLSAPTQSKVIDRLARFLTYREVPFLPELLLEAARAGFSIHPIVSRDLTGYMETFWKTRPGSIWAERVREFLDYFGTRSEAQQNFLLETGLSNQVVRDTRQAESRERLQAAFNTPLYPLILIANEVMQEGLDLQRNCRRVIHHDLTWNPAQLEQRVGRIDRLGSLTRRQREKDGKTTLDIHYPLLSRTIDESLYRKVKNREKWLEFLLGARPKLEEFDLAMDSPIELPVEVAQALAIDLRPRADP